MYKCTSLLVVLLLLTINLSVTSGLKKEIVKQTKFPACKACRTFIESFKRGIEKTSKGKFEGGDAAWEEKKLGSYARSEVRLVEIQENVCSDVGVGQEQCYSLHEEYDNDIEEWWLNMQDDHPDLFKYFCIEKLKHCCPDLHYGPNCSPCPGFPDKVCSNNGKCKGNGTRRGSGKCVCHKGYIGESCDKCDDKYFETYNSKLTTICSPCPNSCEGPCTKSGCEKCAVGWVMNGDGNCDDINECATSNPVCGPSQFCVNTDGSYKCLECDISCTECIGDGPDMCISCAKGFVLVENMCIDEAQEEKRQYIYFTRMLTYIGMCMTTCIIYQKNVVIAAVIGLAVSIYITVSEFMLNSETLPNATELMEELLQ